MIKSGVKETIVSMLGLSMPPILGSLQASLGYWQKSDTAITRSCNPSSKRVSVIAGDVEMIRFVIFTFVFSAQRIDGVTKRAVKNKIAWMILVFINL